MSTAHTTTAWRRFSKLLLLSSGLALAACEAPVDEGGRDISQLVLPTDVVLDLACENAGVFPETCVLSDPANPFVTVSITEFNEADPETEFNKFALASQLPPGPSGAKARYYFWATALARFPSGENQYNTALALHELFDANSNELSTDELARAQALKAYRSVLDNFFGSITVFTAQFGDEVFFFPTALNLLTADALHRTERTQFRRLIDGDPNAAIEFLLNAGYHYSPVADDPATVEDETLQGRIEVIQGP